MRANIAEGGHRVLEEHHPEAGDHEINGLTQRVGLRVADAEVRLRQPGSRCSRLGQFQHRHGNIHPVHGTVSTDSFCRPQ